MPSSGNFTIKADASDAGSRLDVIIAVHRVECSRSFAATLIQAGKIRVDGQPKKAGYRVREGETIHGEIPVFSPPALTPEPIPLNILFEDEHMIVINKPAGMVVHPAPGNYSGTLVNALLFHRPALGGTSGDLRPGIVHRLDKDTSGTVVVAKHRVVHEILSKQFKDRKVQKKYTALLHGEMESDHGVISLPIGRHPVHRKRMSVNGPNGRSAETRWQVISRYKNVTLVDLDLRTGRTHQIRVHCAAIHHPVLGDPVYAGKRRIDKTAQNQNLSNLLQKIQRQMLHARKLSFAHPIEKHHMSFESPIPEDMQSVIDRLTSLHF
jgi:23S rRNA pseudouridine1911/1915/1917 synthase